MIDSPTRSIADAFSVSRSCRSGSRSTMLQMAKIKPLRDGRSASPDSKGDIERRLATLQEEGDLVSLLDVARRALEVGEAPDVGEDALALDLLDDVAALDARLGRCAALLDARHEHALGRLQIEPLRELGRDGPHLEPERRPRPRARVLPRRPLVGRLAYLDLDGLLALIAPDLHLCGLTRREQADAALQVDGALEPLAVELYEDVTSLDPGLCGRAVGHDVAHEHAHRVLDAELARQLGRQRLDLDTEPAAGHAPLVEQLGVNLARHVRRDGEADARAARDDRRVDADDLALHVHQRSAGVARVDRGVGLDEVVERPLADLARLGADDPRGHRRLEAERRPDGEDPIADLGTVGVAELRGAERGLAVIEPEHGEVGLLVHAEDLRLVLTAVERDHLDVGRALNDVGVGEGDPLRVHDDAGAEAPLRDALGQLAEEAAEELLAEELLERRAPLDARAPRHRVDVDDGRLDHLRHRGERHGRQRHLHRHDGHRDLGRRRRPRGWPDLAPGEYAEGDADQHGDRQRAEERLPPQLYHRPAPPTAPGPFTLSPASARRSGSPSSVSTRLSSCAAATRVAFLVVRIPRTRSSVRSRIARTSASIARAVSSL